MGQAAAGVPVALNKAALPPGGAALRFRGGKQGAEVLPGNDPRMLQPLVQGGQVHKFQHFLPAFRGHHVVAEIGQPVPGVAPGADVLMHGRHRGQFNKMPGGKVNIVHGGIDFPQGLNHPGAAGHSFLIQASGRGLPAHGGRRAQGQQRPHMQAGIAHAKKPRRCAPGHHGTGHHTLRVAQASQIRRVLSRAGVQPGQRHAPGLIQQGQPFLRAADPGRPGLGACPGIFIPPIAYRGQPLRLQGINTYALRPIKAAQLRQALPDRLSIFLPLQAAAQKIPDKSCLLGASLITFAHQFPPCAPFSRALPDTWRDPPVQSAPARAPRPRRTGPHRPCRWQ